MGKNRGKQVEPMASETHVFDEENRKFNNERTNAIDTEKSQKRKHKDMERCDHKKLKTEELSSDSQENTSSSTFDSDLHELVGYFEKILQTFKSGLPLDTRELFVVNVLEESKGKEVKLCCHPFTSHCIELLLSFCKEHPVWIQFMTAFSEDKIGVCCNPNASHVVELMLHHSLESIKLLQDVKEDSKEKVHVTFYLSWITEFGDFISDHFVNCLEDQYACHVACSVVRALGGNMTENSMFMSKRSMDHKKNFRFQNVDEDDLNDVPNFTPVVLETIPSSFKSKLRKISRITRQIENISDFVTEGACATVIEALILVLEKRLPKQCQKLIKEVATKLFSEKNSNSVPLAFLHRNTSFVVEKIFSAADEDLQLFLWNEYFVPDLEVIVVHRVGNYIIQRLFDTIKSKSLLEAMCEKTGSFFDKILQAQHYGVFISVTAACILHKACQALLMQNILDCLQLETEEKQLHLIPLLLGFKVYDQKDSDLSVCLQGSLLVQKMWELQKPIKLVKSLQNMKPQDISYLACHLQGCHVLTTFFKSITVGEKNKDRFIQCLKPIMITLACDRNGSLTLSRIWVLLSLKQKGAVVDILVQNEETLKSNKNGNIIFKKFGVFHYKRRYEQWKSMQLTFLGAKPETKTDCK